MWPSLASNSPRSARWCPCRAEFFISPGSAGGCRYRVTRCLAAVVDLFPALFRCATGCRRGMHADVLALSLPLPYTDMPSACRRATLGSLFHGVKAAGGMPGDPAVSCLRSTAPLGPAQFGQVIEHGGPDDAAADATTRDVLHGRQPLFIGQRATLQPDWKTATGREFDSFHSLSRQRRGLTAYISL